MRKMASVKNPESNIKRVILYQENEGGSTYLFSCASLEDGSSTGDDWYESIEIADEACLERYGITADDWEIIDDPLPGCVHDWIAPVRIKGRNTDRPQGVILERLENGVWKECWRDGRTFASYSSQ